jgi:hypothetical protein
METCKCTFETREPSSIARPIKPFFILEARGPQGTTGCVAPLETFPWGRGVLSHGTRGSARALLDREERSGAIGHVVAPESSWVG